MAMAVDNRQQSQLNTMGYEPMRYQQPQFTNPWVASVTSAPSSGMYSATLAAPSTVDSRNAQQQLSRPTSISLPYAGMPVTATSLGTSLPGAGPFEQANLLEVPQQDLLNPSRTFATQQYPSAAAMPQYQMDYRYAQDAARRSSHPLNGSQRNSFSDAIDASHQMLAMRDSDITPRNIYGNQGSSRSSSDSYGFPTHSAHSSISSASYNPSYYSGSVADSSTTDYSSASESVDLNSRTLPRPSQLVGNSQFPPAPQSMMGQFSSKISSSSQKKHKCKICDKRFTRPSSLQTHMYSHTGEKPFACEVEGCGRHFSVVSNLRRHRKVHKSGHDDHPSPDDS